VLEQRGLEPSWGWAAFRRGVAAPPESRSPLRVGELGGAEDEAAFARIVRIGYGLPEAAEARIATAPHAGWTCWLALDRDEPAGGGGALRG
jgi:hypothetical protein